jgi:hypothetical protein
MRRTTIMADEKVLDALRKVAKDEGLTLGEVIRQGLDWRLSMRRRIPSFLAKVPPPSGPPTSDAARRADEHVAEYFREQDARH